MQRWQGLDDVPGDWGCSVVTIGVFDGVHRGHQRIVAGPPRPRPRLGLPVVVITFDPHPIEVVRPGSHPPLLCSVRRRVAAAGRARRATRSACCRSRWTSPGWARMSSSGPCSPTGCTPRRVVVGENFRFGHRAAGDVALLAELGEKYDFGAEGRAAAHRATG